MSRPPPLPPGSFHIMCRFFRPRISSARILSLAYCGVLRTTSTSKGSKLRKVLANQYLGGEDRRDLLLEAGFQSLPRPRPAETSFYEAFVSAA